MSPSRADSRGHWAYWAASAVIINSRTGSAVSVSRIAFYRPCSVAGRLAACRTRPRWTPRR